MPKIAILNHGERSIRDINIIDHDIACSEKEQILTYRVKGEKPFKTMPFSAYLMSRSRFLDLRQINSK